MGEDIVHLEIIDYTILRTFLKKEMYLHQFRILFELFEEAIKALDKKEVYYNKKTDNSLVIIVYTPVTSIQSITLKLYYQNAAYSSNFRVVFDPLAASNFYEKMQEFFRKGISLPEETKDEAIILYEHEVSVK